MGESCVFRRMKKYDCTSGSSVLGLREALVDSVFSPMLRTVRLMAKSCARPSRTMVDYPNYGSKNPGKLESFHRIYRG